MTINEALNLMGLRRGCSEEDIKKAFRILAKKYHPDVSGDENRGKFILINEAYSLLIDKGTQEGCKLTHKSIFNFDRT